VLMGINTSKDTNISVVTNDINDIKIDNINA